ncbi:hypothetical protein ACFPTR_11150 [Aliibacillus thermotolerans]|uniref:Uncharacterized protein n=1 Tax=Aliibacillus thermotolerans TaxID=1834418 RepID=A0ABW0UAT3_9BACI|nr:hypothetical protein [Aliibacillus thermotolerans]
MGLFGGSFIRHLVGIVAFVIVAVILKRKSSHQKEETVSVDQVTS